jgi:uncharacterized protein YjbI with pentapeptide repeats
MIKKHDGSEERAHTFDQLWEQLNAAGPQQLVTTAGTPFVASAAITSKGKRRGERVIRYFQHGEEYGRCYECCWEHHYNCNRTRIAMYSRAVDEWPASGSVTSRLTRQELLKLIEANGGPERLDLSGKDLSGLALGSLAITRDLEAQGISETDDFPAWVHVVNGKPWGINLQGANLSGANLQEADLMGANLRDAYLFVANLPKTFLRNANLQKADLTGADLQEAYLKDANLEEAFLTHANLKGACLWDANLHKTDLEKANLQEAYLKDANLQEARLKDANLQEVDFTSARSVEGAHFYQARLGRTNLSTEKMGRGIGEEKWRKYDEAKEAYLALKTNFESIGRYDDASWAYTKERKMKKVMNHPRHARRYYADEEKLPYNVNWRSTRLWGFYLRHTSKWMMDWVVELVCGYGESFHRVVATLTSVYILFTLGYGVTWSVMRVVTTPDGVARTFTGNPIDWAIFSLGALTTMDPAGLEPRNNLVQLAAGLEALLGIFLTGLLGFVVANRIRRS